MNLILSLTKTRYLLYVEDDWWAVHDDTPVPPLSGAGNFLWRAMEVLKTSTERVAQASGVSHRLGTFAPLVYVCVCARVCVCLFVFFKRYSKVVGSAT